MQNLVASGAYFRSCVTFRPCTSEALLSVPQLGLGNSNNPAGIPLGTIPDLEYASWSGLYGQTKLGKVIVKYTPAQTMGVTNQVSDLGVSTFAASDAIMWTCPFYDNANKFLTSGNVVAIPPDEAGMSTVKVSPYARKHSIYKPWTRVLRPSFFELTTDYIGSTEMARKRGTGYVDLNSASAGGIDLTGLCVMMPALRRGGESDSGTSPQFYPAVGNIFVLGKLTFTYLQMFKTRA